jgi:hypothetical protein
VVVLQAAFIILVLQQRVCNIDALKVMNWPSGTLLIIRELVTNHTVC